MPFYDFKCECGHIWNDHRISNTEVQVPCPKCDKIMERLFPVKVNMKWDRMIPSYMPAPKCLIDDPKEFYR